MANIDQKLTISELDFNDIKSNLKNFLRDQSEFSDFDFEAAGINVLLDILAYNTHYNAFYLNMVANEMFMDTALLRDSVVSHAKTLGYVPTSSTAARATVDLEIYRSAGSAQASLTLPKYTKFQSSVLDGGTSYTFINKDAVVGNYDETCGRFCFHNLYIYQGQPVSYTFTYDATSNINQTFELPDTGIDTGTLQVIVQESSTSVRIETFTLSTDATTVTSNSAIFYIQESRNGKYSIYFGDDIIGKKLVNGNVVIVSYVKTDGAAANKANSFTLAETVGGFSSSVIYPVAAASGGALPESVERIRFSASKFYTSSGRGVTADDIAALINQKYPYFDSVTVWGGDENDPPVYGKVFVSAKPTGGYEITEVEKSSIIADIIKPICVVTVTPEFVDVDYNYINIYAKVYYDPTKTSLSADAIKNVARNAILTYKAADLDTFNSKYKQSRILRTIDDSNLAINYSDADCTIEKRIVPALSATRNYKLDYGTPLAREDSKYRISSSPAYTQYDEDGVLRNCFLEETPGSSSGVESITVVDATNTYESIPSIVISGDGIGANAYPVVVNGKITKIVVDNPGFDYKSATAQLYYQGDLDTTAKFNAFVQNRYGVIRSFYFNNNNIKTIMDATAGSVDYNIGKIVLNGFAPVGISDASRTLKVIARPENHNFESSRNKIITIDEEAANSINIEVIVSQ
jgi:hypothetical protein